MADWNGFKKNGTTYIPNDATARASISTIEGKIPSAASSSNKLVDTSTLTTELNGKVNVSSVGANNGVAGLDANGRVPSSQLPSYVDDVLEYASQSAFPATGETGKIYIALDTNKTYRWSGSAYVEISESLALGETSSTAYAGNKGKANADAIEAMKDGSSIDSFGDVETALAEKVDKIAGKGLSTNDYNNTAKGIVDNIQSNVIANTKLIKDTVGWSGKNVWNLNNPDATYGGSNGVSKTILEKGYNVTRDTAGDWIQLHIIVPSVFKSNTNYKLSTNVTISSGGARFIVYGGTSRSGDFTTITDSQNINENGKKEITFNTGNYTYFRIGLYCTTTSSAVGNVTYDDFMIRPADILDDTYEPFFGSTAFPRSEQAVLGAVNGVKLKDNIATTTVADVVYTPIADAKITAVGTASGESAFEITDNLPIKEGFIIVGCPQGGYPYPANWKYRIQIRLYKNNNWTASRYDYGEGYTFTSADASDFDFYKLALSINSGSTVNITYAPALVVSKDTPYAPYAMTNKELTEKIGDKVDFNAIFLPAKFANVYTGDLNDLPCGVRYIGENAPNSPHDWSIVITFSTSGSDMPTASYGAQIAIGIGYSGMYYRRKDNGTWQNWQSITLS